MSANIAKIGEKSANNVVFNTTDAAANSVYATKEAYTMAMSIIPDDGQTPVNPTAPVARITGPSTLVSGQTYTFSGQSSVGYNGKLLFTWVAAGEPGKLDGDTLTFKAFTAPEPMQRTVKLGVRDAQNGKISHVEFPVTINPANSDTHPPYVENKTPPYAPNEKVSNKGANYQCKPGGESGWCSQAPSFYAPGTGSHWADAWIKID